jgi:hypothetical protein
MVKKKKIEFLMNTDWMFEKPIDSEYKQYKLLSYFQKMGDKLDKLELYPGFIELSLHLMNVQALMRDQKIVYTNKKLTNIDDEILVKDLKVKNLPDLTEEEQKEFRTILTYSAPRIMEYFNIAKSVWSIVFESLDMKVRRSKKNVLHPKGFFYFVDHNKIYHVWEYAIKKETKTNPQKMINVKSIYSEHLNDLTISKIINRFSSFSSVDKKTGPVFHMTSRGVFPLEETLLPMFKRRIAGHISQTKKFEQIKEAKDGIQQEIS